MNVCLVSMPWMPYFSPQAALGSLAAYVRKHAPQIQLDCRYEYLQIWNQAPELYELFGQTVTELYYLCHLYPEKRESVLQRVLNIKSISLSPEENYAQNLKINKEHFEQMAKITGPHLEQLSNDLSRQYDLVGLSASYSQLSASLALAERIKKNDPQTLIVLGGAEVDHDPGAILKLFAFVDFVIAGEGEIAFLDLLLDLEKGQKDFAIESGILTQKNIAGLAIAKGRMAGKKLPDLEALPTPDYHEYFQAAEEFNVQATIPVEGGRGCWWNRVEETGDPHSACYFCGFNPHRVHRQKTAQKLVKEMIELSSLHKNTRFTFTESAFRKKGSVELARALQSSNRDFLFSCPVRPNASPLELLELRDAGCHSIEPGIEGLSRSFLKRVHKGVTVIQNLQLMKTCFELGIVYACNLIVRFPGTTEEEYQETIHNIQQYAISYFPTVPGIGSTRVILYSLEPTSTVFCRPEEFRIANIRNHSMYLDILPQEVGRQLRLCSLIYDDLNPRPEWEGMFEALKQVDELHQRLSKKHDHNRDLCKPLYYLDGGDFLEIVDQRQDLRLLTLEEEWRQVYLFCTRIRSHSEIMKEFSGSPNASCIEQEILPALIAEKVLFEENHHYLSLAVAIRPELAAKRIRSHFSAASNET